MPYGCAGASEFVHRRSLSASPSLSDRCAGFEAACWLGDCLLRLLPSRVPDATSSARQGAAVGCNSRNFRADSDARRKYHVAILQTAGHHRGLSRRPAPMQGDKQAERGIEPVLVRLRRGSTLCFGSAPAGYLDCAERIERLAAAAATACQSELRHVFRRAGL